jgi:DNA-binding NarL/FixJ family response regulator
MDVSMPGVNGLAATQTIAQSHPGTRVVVLTRHSERAYVQQLLRAGACGYVLKQSRSGSLVSAIRAVARGGTYVESPAAGALIDRVARPRAESLTGDGAMTAREEEVLRRVAMGLSNKKIAAELDISVKTVETHKTNVMQKLELRNRGDVIRFALALGWLRNE